MKIKKIYTGSLTNCTYLEFYEDKSILFKFNSPTKHQVITIFKISNNELQIYDFKKNKGITQGLLTINKFYLNFLPIINKVFQNNNIKYLSDFIYLNRNKVFIIK